jgi:hypothetical protein
MVNPSRDHSSKEILQMHRTVTFGLALCALAALSRPAQAQIRLIGITGNQEANPANDETLYEINTTTAATTRLFQTSHVPDSDSIGYNPVDGLLYHTSGSSSYRDTPGQNGYRDNQYMEKINLDTQQMTGVFNANPPVEPDTSIALEFGLPAPFPNWVLPDHPRTDEESDAETGDLVGPGEYDSIREMAWSSTENLFYVSSGRGVYKMTPDGQSTFVGKPSLEGGDIKGLEFVDIGGQSTLVVGSKETGILYQLDTTTGDQVGDPVQVSVDGTPTMRILGLATHPVTGVLYGLLEPPGGDALIDRQLVTIDPATGNAQLIGTLLNTGSAASADAAFAGIAFVGFRTLGGDFDHNGKVDGADFLLWQRGLGTTYTAGDLATFKANFGQGSAVAAASGVPEPTAAVLACLAVGAALGRRRRSF